MRFSVGSLSPLQMAGGQEENPLNSGVSDSFTVSFLGADTKLSLQEMPENKRIWPFLPKRPGVAGSA